MSVHFLTSGVLLLATATSVSQAVQADIKPHWHASEPRVVIPGEYEYKEKAIIEEDSAEKKSVIMRKESLESGSLLEDKRDLYVKVGNNLCDGDGGLWKRYEASGVVPGRYEYCAPLCDQKIECIGFDVGDTGCNLYTQKAVAIGTWPHVRSSHGEAFSGQDSHDLYPSRPLDLTVGTSLFGVKRRFKCYRKSLFRPSTSYYRHIGHGDCTGATPTGGQAQWNRYTLEGAIQTSAQCLDACNLRDECIGFGEVSDRCYLYAQKEVFGTWPNVHMVVEAGVAPNNRFPESPHDLIAANLSSHEDAAQNHSFSHDGSDVSADHGACWGKVYWVALSSYYMKLGAQKCTGGGGEWKHYEVTGGDLDECKKDCDETTLCIGLDFSPDGCRLYVSEAYTGWTSATEKPGTGLHDLYAPDAFSLSPAEAVGDVAGTFCYAKTHHEPVLDHGVSHAKVGIE